MIDLKQVMFYNDYTNFITRIALKFRYRSKITYLYI